MKIIKCQNNHLKVSKKKAVFRAIHKDLQVMQVKAILDKEQVLLVHKIPMKVVNLNHRIVDMINL
jgi:peroxiredoxin